MITRESWLEAVRQAGFDAIEIHAEAMTLREFADLLGLSRSRAEDRMRQLVATGVVTLVRKYVTRSDGSRYPVPAYLLKESTNGTNPVGHRRRRNLRRGRRE